MGSAESWQKNAIRQDETLVGRRMWALSRDSERWRLSNIAHQTGEFWPRGVSEAECALWKNHSDRSPSPHPSCRCGLYAFWTLEELLAQRHEGLVTGIVLAWGRVLPGEEGFQSQYMMPVALDWPRCAGSVNRDPYACLEPAEHLYVNGPLWKERYPREWEDSEAATAYDWVDCACSSLHWRCAAHKGDGTREGNSEAGFWVKAADVMRDLERFYEVDILPVGDFVMEMDLNREIALSDRTRRMRPDLKGWL